MFELNLNTENIISYMDEKKLIYIKKLFKLGRIDLPYLLLYAAICLDLSLLR